MYLSKLIPVALFTALATATAVPSNLEARQQSGCTQAQVGLKQASQYYKSLSSQWQGSAKEAATLLISQLDSDASKVAQTCANLAQMEKNSHETYSGAESDGLDRFS
ncbi:hypothetical protein BDV26DRAFT_298807 [Aspergillus bertholletiae]|uniref:Uncharacterized protein n=1 Tax=Aspergillus bertholletiae TaxID=1226010 RepID=A0A5N7ANI4_9EURO|nr:hypothetical protein BDV26DRAFT_298807 [Aspergillus bertholletiae]